MCYVQADLILEYNFCITERVSSNVVKTHLAAAARLSRTSPHLYDLVLEESSLEDACEVFATFLDSYWDALLPSIPRNTDAGSGGGNSVTRQNVLPLTTPTTTAPTASRPPSNKRNPQNNSSKSSSNNNSNNINNNVHNNVHLNTLPRSTRSSTRSSGPLSLSLQDDEDELEMSELKTTAETKPSRRLVFTKENVSAKASTVQSKQTETQLSTRSTERSKPGGIQRMLSINSSRQVFDDDDSGDEFRQKSPAPSAISQPPLSVAATSQPQQSGLRYASKSEHQLCTATDRRLPAEEEADAEGENPAIVSPVFSGIHTLASHVAISVTGSSPRQDRLGSGKSGKHNSGNGVDTPTTTVVTRTSTRVQLLTPSPLVGGGSGGGLETGTGTNTTSGTEASSLETTPSQSALSFHSRSAPPAVQRAGALPHQTSPLAAENRPDSMRQITVHD